MRYDAFISYSHGADSRLAPAMQRALHRFAKPWYRARAVNVFRDETSLALAHSLPETLTRALAASATFILMASPLAAQSKWVSGECDWWAKHKSPEGLLIVLTDGEIVWDDSVADFDWANTTAVPPVLKGVFKHEPLYLDLRWTKVAAHFSDRDPRFLDAVAKISAALRGMSLDQIAGEDVRQHRRTRRVAFAAMSAITILAAGAASGAWIATENSREAYRQRAIAEHAAEIARAEETKAKAARDSEAAERKRAQTSQSRFLARRAAELLALGNDTLGDLVLIEALPRRTRSGPSRVEVSDVADFAANRLAFSSRRNVVLAGHSARVNSASLSPDGKRVVTASADGTARLWDSLNGRQVAVLRGHEKAVASAAWSADGKRVLTASEDGTASVWDAETGRELAVLAGHTGPVHFARFSPDRKRVLTTSSDNTARLWDPDAGREVAVLRRDDDKSLIFAAFSADSRHVVTTGNYTASLWDTDRGLEIRVFRGHEWGSVRSAQFSANGSWVLTASSDKTARIWDVASGRQVALFKHEAEVNSAAFSGEGKQVVTAVADKTARIWDSETATEIAVLRGHDSVVNSAMFSADGSRVVTGSSDTARVWNAANGQPIAAMRGHSGLVHSTEISADGKWVLTASGDKTARLWSVETSREIGTLRHGIGLFFATFGADDKRILTASSSGAKLWNTDTNESIAELRPGSALRSAAFSPDGKLVVTALEDGTARLWDARNGQELRVLRGHNEEALFAAFNASGSRVVTASKDKVARVWDTVSGRVVATLDGHSSAVSSAVLSPDGNRAVTSSWDKTARLWDAESGRQISVLETAVVEFNLTSAVFSSDSKKVVTTSQNESPQLWDAENGRQLAVLTGHDHTVYSAAFSMDSLRVVTASADYTARVWDAITGRPIATLRGHRSSVHSAVFSPDSRLVLTHSRDRTARLWDSQSGKEIGVFGGRNEEIHSAAFSGDNRRVVTVSNNGVARVWHIPDRWLPTDYSGLLDLRTYRLLDQRERATFFVSLPSPSTSSDRGTCEGLAAHPFDPANPANIGVAVIADATAAINRCQQELGARPADPRLNFLLARAYGSVRRNQEALISLNVAVQANYPMALYLMASHHANGAGVIVNRKAASDQYRAAINAGVIAAAVELGELLWFGHGVTQDRAAALELWNRAAAAGIPRAHGWLAYLRLTGEGITQSRADALFHHALAARLYEEYGYVAEAAQTRVMQANIAQFSNIRELQEALRRIESWTTSIDAPRRSRD